MTSRSSLWTDRPSGSDHDWLAQAPAPPRRPAPPPPPPPPPRRRRRVMIGALASLGLLTLVGGALVVEDRLDGDRPVASPAAPAAVLPAAKGRPAETRINEIYAATSAGVVSIQVADGTSGSSGTGFVLDSDGTIVTNAHVVGGADRVRVRFDDKSDGVEARVLGSDPSSDLAVLRVDPSSAKLQPLTLADSDDVRVGDATIAIGYPLGLDRTATSGIVSGLGRQIKAPNGFQIDEVIQTDAPINPGNSGGPLLDARGRVIGVNSQIATAGGGGSVGIGFAVPSNTVREIVPQLKAGRSIRRSYIGVVTSPAIEGNGATVMEVTPGGPAQGAGIQLGDTIKSVDGKTVTGPDDVAAAIKELPPGESVDIVIRRGGSQVRLDVELGRRPDRMP